MDTVLKVRRIGDAEGFSLGTVEDVAESEEVVVTREDETDWGVDYEEGVELRIEEAIRVIGLARFIGLVAKVVGKLEGRNGFFRRIYKLVSGVEGRVRRLEGRIEE